VPFKSSAQRAFMHMHHPEIAGRWERETPKGRRLPKHVGVDELTSVLGLSLSEAEAILEVGQQNSTAMVVVPGGPPGRNVCALVRSLANGRSRLIVVAQSGGLAPGSYERMLRASLPDCEKRIRVIDADGSLVEMISAAERNHHYSPKQALEVFCDSRLAAGFRHDSTTLGLDFDPGLVSVRPISVPTDDVQAIERAVQGDDPVAQHRVLDPHLFSNPEGMAEYKSSLLGEGLLREFLSDVDPDRDIAIQTLRDLLSAEVGDIEGLQYLGSGRNGSAYRHPDGFILKVTTDPVEACSAERLVGLTTDHLGRVYGIRPLTEGVWLIAQEDLGHLPHDLAEEFDLAMETLELLGALDHLNEGRALDALIAVADLAERPVSLFVAEVFRRFEIIEICREMRMLGLTGDFHSGNVMVRGSSPVLTDLGTPGDDPNSKNEVLGGTGRRINEFGTGAPGSGASGPATMRGSNSSSWSNGRGALKSPANFVPEDENADESDYALDWGPGRVTGASY
jgi:hypothetical protein